MKKTLLASTLLITTSTANAVPVSTRGTFDMYDPTGALIGTDSTITGFVDESDGTWGISSTSTFYGLLWTAHNGVLYGEGSYSIDTIEGAMLDVTIGADQIGGHILFDWGVTTNIDIFNVWDINADGSLSYATVPGMVDGPFPGFRASFELTNPDLVSAIPVPAAVWLFSSGLLCLAGVSLRRKAA